MLNLIYGLLFLAVVIALIGIANTLALSIHERRREIGLLRAVGMTRGQVRRAVRWEAVLIALLGTALGALLAIGGAWGIVQALADQDVTTFAIPTVQLIVITLLAGACRCGGRGRAGSPGRQARRAGRDQHGLIEPGPLERRAGPAPVGPARLRGPFASVDPRPDAVC